ncbi:hypothetical protein WDZ16_13675 [Pseudokineococcus marinus]|uniref:Uncharacterized protein n=1 Tax=Pseudokineococcus marinus TaxID=351215 RepID=A0A849BMX7_9ACTN|nr:hypothetical protein [Pseudokineococcus marinus]NNH24659.1 hypothetical protein [Pseudokineococcus marinus]
MPVAPTSRLAALAGSAGLVLALGAGPALAATPSTTSSAAPSTTSSAAPSASADVELAGEACPEDEGATVLVDPQGLAGGDLAAPTAGCALEAPDGLTALTEAGFTATESQPGFVCTIEGLPAPDQADCLNDGYWAYWYAPRDGEWTSSQVGAADRVPEVGGVEAWSWTELSGDSLEGAPPRVEPAAVAALPVAGEAAPTGTSSPSATPTGAPENGTAGDSPAVDPEGADASEVEASSEEAASVPWTTIVVVVVVAALVVLALVLGALRARRRRDEEMDERRSDAR